MKVLQINSFCGVGSTGRIATDIHDILVELGHESYIAYGRDLHKNCDSTVKIGTKIDSYFHVAKTRILDKHGLGSKRATEEFIEKVKEFNPDIIHLHNIHGYYLNIEILFNYIKEENKPVVWTLHDCWSFTGHCAYFDYVGCDKWKLGCHNCPEKTAYPSSLILDNSKNNYAIKKKIFSGINDLTIVTPSRWLAELVQNSFLKDYNVIVINNGIDLNTFKPEDGNFRIKYKIENKHVILGVASVWDRRKGLKFFVELADKVSDDEVIVLVGLNETQLKVLPKSIIGITRTNKVEELVSIYTSADVFVNPTLEDNFPTTNLEALACGTPIITFNTGGSPESVNSSSGIVLNEKTSDAIYDSIQLLKSDHKNKKEKLINIAQTKYNKDKKFREYIKLYEKIYAKYE